MVGKRWISPRAAGALALMAALTLAGCGGAATAPVASQTSPSPAMGDVLALVNCRLIDGTGAAAVEDAVVMVSGGKVWKAGPKGSAEVPQGARVVDLKGATVMPGFINAHVHKAYDEKTLQTWLAAGVTTVRDEGPFTTDNFLAERDRLNKKPENATIVSATPLLTVPDGYGTASFTSAEEAKKSVEGYVARGVDIIKFSIEDNLQGRAWALPTQEEIKAVVDTAHAGGRRASVHICHTRNLSAAVDAGVDDIAHMTVEPVDAALIRRIIDAGICWEPTLELWKGVSETYGAAWLDVPLQNLSAFYKAGGKIALGTDFAGYTCSFDTGFPITEVKLMQKAGMPAMDIIVAGTKNAAEVCGLSGVKGTVAPGMDADLLIVTGDPLKDLNALLNVRMVVHGGEVAVDNAPIAATSAAAPGTVQRDYWPTSGWKTTTPEEQGMDSAALAKLDEYINANQKNIHSFLIVRHGYLVYEKYYANQGQKFGREDVHWLASATKSFTGALIGIAIQEGFIKGIDEKVAGFFPGDIPANPDGRFMNVEIRHLLTMTAGFDWDDAYDDSKEDRVKFALNRPMRSDPGQAFNYDSPGSNLLSAIITKTTGMNARQYAETRLFGPLGIDAVTWQEDNRGNSQGDAMLALRPLDMAKFGFLYLNGGQWDGRQIVPSAWVSQSTAKQNDGGPPHNAGYGYQCWVTSDSDHAAFFAGGFGGQFIYVVPDLDLVVVITSDWDRHHEENRALVGKFVIPAIRD